MKEKKEQAAEYFMSGYNCAQSVVAVFAGEIGIDVETALKLSSGFGGGMGGMQGTCGVVTGAVMVIGSHFYLKEPYNSTKSKEAIQYFFEKFTGAHGTSVCRELTAPVNTSLAENVHEDNCRNFIKSGVGIIQSIIS